MSRRRAGCAVIAALLGAGIAAATVVVAYVALSEPAGPEPVEYVVVRGDTLGQIATAHGVTVDELREWNGLSGDLIEVGQVLRIYPASSSAAPAPPVKKKKRAKVTSTVQADPSGSAFPALVLPPERACLQGPTEVAADYGMAGSVGLDEAQVRGAMDAFVQQTLRCVPPGGVDGTVDTEITVACTGRVARVEVTDTRGVPADVAACVQDTLRYVPFPAHDMPDGFVFDYPLRFQP